MLENWMGEYVKMGEKIKAVSDSYGESTRLLKESNRSQKQTLLLITHDEALAMQADRMIYLEDGRLVKNEVIRGNV